MSRHITTLQDRVTILQLAQAQQSDGQIAQALGCSPATVRKWRRRAQQHKGFASQMGRPATGSLSSFPPLVVETLHTWRDGHPGWGPMTLLTQAHDHPALADLSLPARSSIGRWLKDEQVTRRYERHRDLPQPAAAPARFAHDAWEMDAQGYERVAGVGIVQLIDLNDRYSKAKILCYPCLVGETRVTHLPDAGDYQLAARLAFCEWGLPDQLAVDRDTLYYDSRSKSPFPTYLHLWLLALGVAVLFGPPGQPTVRAQTERSHQIWDQQVLDGQVFANWDALWATVQQRRQFLNHCLPCTSCGNQPPLVACADALRPRRVYRPQWEQERLDLSHIWMYLSQGHWFRRSNNVGAVTLGHRLYSLGRAWAGQDVVLTFDASDQHLLFVAQDGRLTKRLPIKGITREILLGELERLLRLQPSQLPLPLSWHDWRMIRLSETLGGTT